MLIEENMNDCDTDTVPIPLLDVERKTVPVICPRCNEITGVAKWYVERNMKILPVYKTWRSQLLLPINVISNPESI